MKKIQYILFLIGLIALGSCQKAEPPVQNNLPEGATPYTENDIQFVPYTSSSVVFKRMPLLDSNLTLQFVERRRTEEYFAWDQTFFTMSHNPELELELRLRYLQTDNSQKTLAVYMPYVDGFGTNRTNIFEMPIDPTGVESGFFENIVEVHDTLVINSVEWYNVLEVTELISTDPEKDGQQNFSRIFYNTSYGLIKMVQKNGTVWVLQP
jgi:hypothetical protein